jgi:hypothetical protein
MRQAEFLTVLLVCASVAGVACGDIDNNDHFASRSIYDASGVDFLTVSGSIIGGSGALRPDTTLGVFDEFGVELADDDDGSILGDGMASGLYRVPVNADRSIRLAVSGYEDFDFDGMIDRSGGKPHKQAGDYDLYIDIRDAAGDLTGETFFFESALTRGAVDRFAPDTSSLSPQAASFDVYIDNVSPFILGADPVDFLSFTGLTPGDSFEAEIISGDFDTVLGRFDSAGGLIEFSDDVNRTSLLSKLSGTVPQDGELIFAISGFPDGGEDRFPFDGRHSERGAYELALNFNPEPATLMFLAWGLPVMLRRRTAR